MSTAEADALAQMTQSDDVRKRGRGVIGTWLADNTDIPDVLEATEGLIEAERAAGLVTMIKDDLDRHIDAAKEGALDPVRRVVAAIGDRPLPTTEQWALLKSRVGL